MVPLVDPVGAQASLSQLLRDARRGAGLTQQQLADAVFVSRSTIACIETGRQSSDRDFWARVDSVTRSSGVLLAAYDRMRHLRQAHAEQVTVTNGERTDPSGIGSSAFLGSSVHLWEFHEALNGRTVGERGLTLIELTSRDLDRIYAHSPATDLLPEVTNQLAKVVEYLGWPQPVGHRRRLCSIAGRLAGLRAWLHFDLADTSTANAWYALAIDAAREAEDWSLLGWLYGGRSLIPFQRGQHHDALALVNAGRDICPPGADPAVHAWLTALQARALAAIGDRPGFERACDRAMTVSVAATTDQQRHGMDFHDGRLDLNYYRGGGLLALGHAADAAQALQSALDILPDTRPKARAVLTLNLAQAAVTTGALDEAADMVGRALAMTRRQPIMPIVTMARAVTADLRSRGFRDPSTMDTVNSMYDTLAIQSGTRT